MAFGTVGATEENMDIFVSILKKPKLPNVGDIGKPSTALAPKNRALVIAGRNWFLYSMKKTIFIDLLCSF
jgi:hypothetical protein